MKIFQALISIAILVGQVASSVPHTATDQSVALAQTAGTKTEVVFDLHNPDPFKLNVKPAPNFGVEVVEPLKAVQAQRAAEVAAAKVKTKASKWVIQVRAITGDVWTQLRFCEAGGVYTKNTGNGFYGAYQYDLSTWNHYQGYARPDLAPAAVQDAKAHDTQARRGWSPWPTCSRKLGLR